MSVHYEDEMVTLHHGDCIEVMRELADESVHAVVTDPPYGLEFMGREWDGADGFRRSLNAADTGRDNVFGRTSSTSPEYRADATFQRWCEVWARECLRILKPGGHLLSFGGSRTWHRLAAGIEDAGFEMRDSIAWLYGSGFPKSLSVAKAIDAHLTTGGSSSRRLREVEQAGDGAAYQMTGKNNGIMGETVVVDRKEFAPASEQAQTWVGWGTALKPSFEPIVVARKPLAGTVAANVLEHGTGALNIDGTRIGNDARVNPAAANKAGGASLNMSVAGMPQGVEPREATGRWPANVVLDESQAAALDSQTGILTSGANPTSRGSDRFRNAYGDFKGQTEIEPARGADSGGASRFFPTFHYEAKAPGHERPEAGGVQHPTVKPLDLMRWLVRLVTPPNGVVLEPFAGSGTTLEAAVLEGFTVIGIEREADYLPLIEQRLSKPMQQSLFGDWDGAA